VSVDELAHRQAEKGKGATGSEVDAQQRCFLRSVDHKEAVVGSRDDGSGEALADTEPPAIGDAQLVVTQVDNELDRPLGRIRSRRCRGR
jgi:hypothetical protein